MCCHMHCAECGNETMFLTMHPDKRQPFRLCSTCMPTTEDQNKFMREWKKPAK